MRVFMLISPFQKMSALGVALLRDAEQDVGTTPFGLALQPPALFSAGRYRVDESIAGDARFYEPACAAIRARRLQLRRRRQRNHTTAVTCVIAAGSLPYSTPVPRIGSAPPVG